MKKVNVLIEVDEKYYRSIKEQGSFSTATYQGELLQAIANGTPITEGDLISRSEWREKIPKEGEQWKANTEYECGRFDSCDMIDFLVANAPSIGGNQNE